MRRTFPLLTALALLSTLLLVGCPAGSPEEQVAAKRADFTVELNSWYATVENEAMDEMAEAVEGEAVEGEADDAGDEGEAADDAGDEMDGDAMAGDEMDGDAMSDMTGPQPHTIVFDLLVAYNGRGDALPGITLKVTHAAAGGTEKDSWLEYIELPQMTKSVPEQVAFQKEGVLFEEGDVFAVNLSKSVPAAERSQYREFQAAGN